jgi:hypothetical protein
MSGSLCKSSVEISRNAAFPGQKMTLSSVKAEPCRCWVSATAFRATSEANSGSKLLSPAAFIASIDGVGVEMLAARAATPSLTRAGGGAELSAAALTALPSVEGRRSRALRSKPRRRMASETFLRSGSVPLCRPAMCTITECRSPAPSSSIFSTC